VGTAVFGGMIVSTLLNLGIIPVLYVIVRTLTPGKNVRSEPEAPLSTQVPAEPREGGHA
jgi:hypothetical protein